MDVLKQCQVCKVEVASCTCKKCGALVGKNCFDSESAVCVVCRGGKRIKDLL
ncbi:hypothetical protein HN419_02685 [Candidatus Woesearchaeota archaeon]|jgi:hypothetical protein|nr:hypothetical protein [Candidatus Woesearchaeota archaeon]MBT3537096.1 hypothetical protein [Candidatus Woesearchaeota archaeon]MBT4716445.1 hypothetical protein [Candidatus Woesearchaeota archaeon]MBT7106594.1 hypothetical protein [Candidatus Woesearchaeota archaeon]MBT7931031.1 hypothetical protein [Candidatus Woesearchaeota archaeon]